MGFGLELNDCLVCGMAAHGDFCDSCRACPDIDLSKYKKHGASMIDITKNLKRLRKEKGFTQSTLAAKAGLSRVGYGKIETGKSDPRINTLLNIAKVLDVTICWRANKRKQQQNIVRRE